jgi:hypothetical protein
MGVTDKKAHGYYIQSASVFYLKKSLNAWRPNRYARDGIRAGAQAI